MKIVFRILIILLIFQLFASNAYSNKWETIVYNTDLWSYFPGISEPAQAWNQPDYDASSWLTGSGGIGYGDEDDNTVISSTISLYMRIDFSLNDQTLQQIGGLLLHADYDDGFVAYLNGTEIARSNLEGSPPPFNQLAVQNHEAMIYQGGIPSVFPLGNEHLRVGQNVLAIQVHNVVSNSSDLSSIFFLSAETSGTEQFFRPVPEWFAAPVQFASSNLPILVINTENQNQIPDEPKITASMGIIHNETGQINYLSDPYNHYNGQIGIELRGNSSQSFPKKPYNIETRDALGDNLNVSLFGMPEENDWVLRSSYMDHTFVRNPLAMHMSRQTGRWASRCQMVEMVLNGTYQGIYIFMEKIKWDKGRVDISKLDVTEINAPLISGGYIYEVSGFGNDLGESRKLKYPKFDEAAPEQINYITNYDNGFRDCMDSPDFMDVTTGYHGWIDVLSFTSELIVHEAMRNSDAYGWSAYFHKDREGKINAGPVWDFDQSAGNSSYPDNGVTEEWLFSHPATNNTPFFWEKLFSDLSFRYRVRVQWEKLRENEFKTDQLLSYIDSIASQLSEAQAREFDLWPVLGQNIWRETFGFEQRSSYQKEVDYLKSFLTQRWEWMDGELARISAPDNTAAQQKENGGAALYVFPNPASEFLIFEFNTEREASAEIRIYNTSGRLVQKTPRIELSSGTYQYRLEFDVAGCSGLYFYQISIGNKTLYSGRFIRL